eukprot:TRINITY_DN7764_c0_g1_i1.p1 TRINITY_DN7764_c0_g1~~TRINITY_DN7764_c0_g1_i1.p1  ORF type:complete len:424 (+),score=52.50 TRINITY_DN7764_c0_g1_i1:56-1327(+)
MIGNSGHVEQSRGATPRQRRTSDATAPKRPSLKPISRGNRRNSTRYAAEQGEAIDMRAFWRLARLEYQTLKREEYGDFDGPASLSYAADAIAAAVGTFRRRRSKFATLVEASWLHESTEKKVNQRLRSRLEVTVHPRELDLLLEGITQTWKELLILQCRSFAKACAILTAAFFSERVLVGQAGEWRINLRCKLSKLIVLQVDDGDVNHGVEMLTGIVARAETIKSYLDRTARSFSLGSFRWARNFHRDLHATRRIGAIQEYREAAEAAVAFAKTSECGARRVSAADILARQLEQEKLMAEKRRRRAEIVGMSAGRRHDVPLLDTLPDLSNKFPCALEWEPFHGSCREKVSYSRPSVTTCSDPRDIAVPLKPLSAGKDGRQAYRPRSALTGRVHAKATPSTLAAMDQDQLEPMPQYMSHLLATA